MGSSTSKAKKRKNTLRNLTSPSLSPRNCKQCFSSQTYGHCCYNECFPSIFHAQEFVDLTETEWQFNKKHEIELYNILLALDLESIIPVISEYLPNPNNMDKARNQHDDDEAEQHAQGKHVHIKNNSLAPIRMHNKVRSLSVPYYVPDIDISSSAYNVASTKKLAHAYFHGYVSVYNRDSPPCFVWMKATLPFDDYDDRASHKKKKLQITVIGDTGVGKSTLIRRYVLNEFSEHYTPTIADCYTNTMLLGGSEPDYAANSKHVQTRKQSKKRRGGKPIEYDFDQSKVELEILDTAGGDAIGMADDMEEWIEKGHVFLLCFDITRALTLHYIKSYIIPRIQRHFEEKLKVNASFTLDRSTHVGPACLILVGCKVDLRNDIQDDAIEHNMSREILNNYNNAMKLAKAMQIPYIETSSKDGTNVEFLMKQCLYEYWLQQQTNCIKWTL